MNVAKYNPTLYFPGTPLPTITWSRLDGRLPADSILGDGILIIPSAKMDDAGTYRCEAVNEAGSVSQNVVLYVREHHHSLMSSLTLEPHHSLIISLTLDHHHSLISSGTLEPHHSLMSSLT
ncbi:PGBM-like protein [Mya arenaria]|uniref:PGBM-like protein n=1 Tax=Mya arenaria TaxID=6604 RepID=A0ABY7F2A8_MYAAR|nr:PGBM-like protein [Mya arenaria]